MIMGRSQHTIKRRYTVDQNTFETIVEKEIKKFPEVSVDHYKKYDIYGWIGGKNG